MVDPKIPGEKVHTFGTLTNASNLYVAENSPNLVLRRPIRTEVLKNERTITNGDRRFAELLIELEEGYGIRSPKMQSRKVVSNHDGTESIYIGAEKIIGENLWEGRNNIKPDILEKALQTIISYYRDVMDGGGDYITDLTPINIVYGHPFSDPENNLYFIDVDPYFWSKMDQKSTKIDSNVEFRVLPKISYLIKFGIDRGYDWSHLENQLRVLRTLLTPSQSQ